MERRGTTPLLQELVQALGENTADCHKLITTIFTPAILKERRSPYTPSLPLFQKLNYLRETRKLLAGFTGKFYQKLNLVGNLFRIIYDHIDIWCPVFKF